MSKKTRYILVILVVLALIVVWVMFFATKTYRNNEIGYEIEHPYNWEVKNLGAKDDYKNRVVIVLNGSGDQKWKAVQIFVSDIKLPEEYKEHVFPLDKLDEKGRAEFLRGVESSSDETVYSGYYKLNDGHTAMFHYTKYTNKNSKNALYLYTLFIFRGTEKIEAKWLFFDLGEPDIKEIEEATKFLKTLHVK